MPIPPLLDENDTTIFVYNHVSVDTNLMLVILLSIFALVSLIIAIRSQGIYKSVIGFTGVCLVALGLILKDYIIDNTLFYSSIIVLNIFQWILYVVGIGMVLMAVLNLFSGKK